MKIKSNIRLIIVLIVFNVAACSPTVRHGNYERIAGISLEELTNGINSTEPVTIDELLNSREELEENKIDVEINNASAKVLIINNSKYLARAFRVNKDSSKKIEITSYIVPVKKHADYLFFPVLTLYDDSKEVLAELRPEEGYSVHGGMLKARFTIPTGASYILIHTKQEYLDIGSIDGSKGGLSPTVSYSSSDVGIALGAALGGVVGGAIAGAMTANSYYSDAPPENYFFGPGGILDIRLLEEGD